MMTSSKGLIYLAALALLAFVCHAATGSNANLDPTTTNAVAVDANGDDTASIPDFDGDGTIGFGDFVKFAAKFGLGQGDDGYDALYDLDRNGIIGFSDFVIFAQNFGKEATSPVVTIPDANLRAAIETALGKASDAPITVAEMASLTSLSVSEVGIFDLTGLEFATSLENLELVGNDILDVSAIAPLTGLKSLSLGVNDIADISALAGLTNLTRLSLGVNDITDISALVGLISLKSLDLVGNNIADISALVGLTNLQSLDLRDNKVANISAIAGLISLTTLDLAHNDIARISPLEGLTSLTILSLGANNISDISALANLTNLIGMDLGHNNISDISPLAGLTELLILELNLNDIVDISSLTGLVNLLAVELFGNNISDLAPLTANRGLGSGDNVDVTSNPLNPKSIGTHIPALKARGISILFDEIVVIAAPQIYNDNVFVLPVAEHLPAFRFPMRDYAARFYEYFNDAFDFLLFMSNVYFEQLEDEVTVADHYIHVGNDVRGIGLTRFFVDRWGSAGKLQGAIFSSSVSHKAITEHTRLFGGATLHELMHRWGNYIVPPFPHFGHTSSNGKLGGFDITTLVDHGDGRYSAGRRQFYRGYSPLELYLAGYVPAEAVPDLIVLVNAEGRHGGFTASKKKTNSIEDIIAEYGPRVPDHLESQKHFRAAVILLVSEEYPATRWILDTLSNDVTLFSHVGEDKDDQTDNFYEATGGRGTITMGGLAQFQRGAGAKIVIPRSFGTPPPLIVDHWDNRNGHDDADRTLRHIPAEPEQP